MEKQFDLYEDLNELCVVYTTEEGDNFHHRRLVGTSNDDGIITAFGYYYGEYDDVCLNFHTTFESLVEQAKEEASEDVPLIKVVEYEFYIAYNGELVQDEKRVERIKYEG